MFKSVYRLFILSLLFVLLAGCRTVTLKESDFNLTLSQDKKSLLA
jgi:hypothetical protein